MRAESTGFATLLLFVLLGVVAVVGLFGIPRFSPGAASPSYGTGETLTHSIGPIHEVGVGESSTQGAEDLFAPISTSRSTNRSRVAEEDPPLQGQTATGELSSEALDGWAVQVNSSSESPAKLRLLAFGEPESKLDGWRGVSGSVAPSFAGRGHEDLVPATRPPTVGDSSQVRPFAQGRIESPGSTANEPRPRQKLTWRAAVDELNALGIRQYRLWPGEQPSEFHFRCRFIPPENPRMARRFEAEADEPLRAVEKVLTQIRAWLAER